ncbi:MAG: Calx-beta domain-containing protein [Pseudomonadota bacterium]
MGRYFGPVLLACALIAGCSGEAQDSSGAFSAKSGGANGSGTTRLVDRTGNTPSAYTSIAAAVVDVVPGDTIKLVPGTGPYRETVNIDVTGTQEAPIVFDGSGETVTGFEPFQFTYNGTTAQWEYVLPAPIPNGTPGTVDKPFRHLVTYQGQRLLLLSGTTKFTSDFATVSADGTRLILGNASASEGWEIGTRKFVMRIDGFMGTSANPIPKRFFHVYRNVSATGSTQDGFNVHGTGTNLVYENIKGYNNWDEGFSSHDYVECSIDGGSFWANDNGLLNQSTANLAFHANNIRSMGNLGFGIAMRQGVNRLTNSVAWDNGIQNISLGGSLTGYSNVTYESRSATRLFTAYQESQNLDPSSVPYTYEPFWKDRAATDNRQAYVLTGEEPVVLPLSQLPPFPLGYEDWRYFYFSHSQIDDPATSAREADPDSDGISNFDEFRHGTLPLTADAPALRLSVSVPDVLASESTADPGLYQIERTGPTDFPLITYFSMQGTATEGEDYSPVGTYVEIPANQSSVQLPLGPLTDALDDPGEIAALRLLPDSTYSIGRASGTVIIDATDGPHIDVIATDRSASETLGETGTFLIRRNSASTEALTVYFTLAGSAQSDVDYPSLGNSAVIPAGSSAVEVVLTALDDGISESTETAVMSLVPDSSYIVSSYTATVEIEGVALATVSMIDPDISAAEGPVVDEGRVTLSRSSGTDSELTVFINVSGTATNGTDYETIGSSVVFPVGVSTVDVVVKPLVDTISESGESVVIALSASDTYARSGSLTTTITISNYNLPTLSVTTTDNSASEAAGNIGSYTINRTGSKTAPLMVRLLLEGTATNGIDYSMIESTVEIPAGSSSVAITVTGVADNVTEGSETTILRIDASPAYLVGSPSTGTVTIADVPPPTVSLSVTDGSASEAVGNTGVFTINRTGAKTAALSVQLVLEGTASNGVDYAAIGQTVIIPAGASSVGVTISPIADNLTEGNETAVLRIDSSPSYLLGTTVSGTVTIIDVPPPTVTMTVSDGSASEDGNNSGTFTINRTGSKTAALTVNFAMSGTASNGSDYTSLSGSVDIPAGASSVLVSVRPLMDTLTEPSETAVLTLSARPGYVLGSTTTGTVAIADIPPATVSVSVSDSTASESGDAGAFTLTRSGNQSAAMMVNYTVTGSASSGSDYTALSGTVEIPAGAGAITVPVSPLSDFLLEGNETVVLNLSAGSTYVPGTPASGTVSITDIPPPVITVQATDADASESGDTGLFTISRSDSTATALSVQLAISGSASSETDYNPISSAVDFPAGSSVVTITITPLDDRLPETSETVVLQVLEGSFYAVGEPSSATVIIADVPPPTVTLTVPDATASEAGDSGHVTIERSGSTTSALTVNFQIDGTAINGEDYTAIGNSVLIPAGFSAVTIDVAPTPDELEEGFETAIFSLHQDPQYLVGEVSSGTVNIEDVAVGTVTVSVTVPDAEASESGDSGYFTISRSESQTNELTVNFLLEGSAGNGSDFMTIGFTAVIPADATSVDVYVIPEADRLLEGSETVVLRIDTSADYAVAAPSTGTVTIADVPPPVITVTAPDASASESGDAGLFMVSRSGSNTEPMLVQFSVQGSASNDIDYSGIASAIEIPAGADSVVVAVNPLPDYLVEGDETVILQIGPSDAYVVGADSSAVIVIVDVPPPTLTVSVIDASASESGDMGRFRVTRNGASSTALTVQLIFEGTASNGSDYGPIASTVVIPQGESFVEITVNPNADNLNEASETVVLSLGSSSEYLLGATTSGTVTIAEVAAPTISISVPDSSASESGTNNGLYTVSRTGSTATALTVKLLLEGTATNGTDYGAIAASVQIPSGTNAVSIPLNPLADNLTEASETAILRIDTSPEYLVGPAASGTVNIANVAPPSVTVTTTDSNADESGGNTGTFTINRTGSRTSPLTVTYTISGTASNGTDYNSLTGTVDIPVNAGSVPINVMPLGDTLVEAQETVVITLSSNSAYALGSTVSGTVKITDVPPATVSVSATDPSASESGDTGTFTVSRSGAMTHPLMVYFTIAGTASNGQDYASVNTSVQIPVNAASATVTISPLTDEQLEDVESVDFHLVAGGNYLLSSSSNFAVVQIGDVPPP